ncbi:MULTISPECIES: hypothetical protein [unclassified Moorena]|nr:MULTISPECIES: hypothetical protein [unclassified Moorena]NEO23196.1 hypothetical protein [Moorena sp. SIO4A5]NEP23659.1 hypothetical protein [Moorena sp. SIO3I6]NEQ57518.1 hypothetical protein [Moorena sp. SIO4A1]
MSTKTLVWGDAKAIANQVRTITEVTPEINNRQLITYRKRLCCQGFLLFP